MNLYKLLFCILCLSTISYEITRAASFPIHPELDPVSVGIESYAINIFCTEMLHDGNIKAVSGSGVFLSNPDETKSAVLTNAHVARHLLDVNKKCVGRTGNPAATTHTLTLRYIPNAWLRQNAGFIIGDTNQISTGEFDFAILEGERILPKKDLSLYDILKPRLRFQLKDYIDTASTTSLSQGLILSYPAESTLSKNIYSPLFLKKDKMHIKTSFISPALQEDESLLDSYGSTYIDHGSSGGMAILQNTSNNLIGLSSVLIGSSSPQTVRIVTLKHIFSVMEKELATSQNPQRHLLLGLLEEIKRSRATAPDLGNTLSDQKFFSTEPEINAVLKNLGIISK